MAENKKPQAPKKPKFNPYWISGALLIALIAFQVFGSSDTNDNKKITPIEFFQTLKSGEIDHFDIIKNTGYVKVYLTDDAAKLKKHAKSVSTGFSLASTKMPNYIFQYGDLSNFEDKYTQIIDDNNLTTEYDNNREENILADILISVLPFLLLIGIWLFIMKRMSGGAGGGAGGQIFNIGKSKAKLFDENTKVKTTFKDVAGLEGAKEEVQEIVDFLKNPEKYTSLGGKIPKGALLVGPPGTGKTLLAKAVAGEAKVPFFSLSGSDFVEMFVGVGASRVRDLFKQAKEKSPAIIFIDEIDAIGRARGKNAMSGSNDERENTLNQLLTEMDGFGTNTNVIVLAATNRADVLDKALMRAGRFDRQIHVDLPNLTERRAIFDVHLRPLKKVEGLDLDFLAKQTPGFSGADIANLCNEAALIAARNNKKAVDKQDFLDAVDRVIGGLEKRSHLFSVEEKKTIAYHEAGHATVSWFLEHADPLVKVTIVPRGRSLGAAWYLPQEAYITRTSKFLDEICVTMGGRAAEKIIFNEISTGALSDLENVTKKAKAMVMIYGLNEKVGNITYYDPAGESGFVKPYSESTAELIDNEIKNIVETEYTRALELLTSKRDVLEKLANRLMEREVIFKDDLEEILGKRPFDTIEDKPSQKLVSENKEEKKEEE
ncbi:ATP-dependent zinc metalloprotease FtsH [Lacinutrix mariniflava]|uniref:ATP-dependent zinc metalloprotease FtsH n=1 Tax=Lacinutrix mariniflava TaxID=342955 RepID=UPI0006E38CE9|nr:ATP-dependent zinc metalloprotease FtsH [Lacinutrix mariniflava]